MENKRVKRKYRLWLKILALLILILIGIRIFSVLFKKEEEEEIKVVDVISSYDYTLEDRDTTLMKDTYNDLKKVLNEDTINMEEYAKNIAKLFIIDLFTIDNKRNKYDVGGADYVYPDAVLNYKLNVEETLYKLIKNNTDGKRKQDLPVVKSIDIKNVEKSEYKVQEKDSYPSFVIDLTWDYERDLGYDTKAKVTVIEKDEKIYVVEYEVGD